MSLYSDTRINPPAFEVKTDAGEVIFKLVSAMCDNRSTLRFKKNADGYFYANLVGEAFSNIQIKHDKLDVEWAADDQQWDNVVDMINTGTSRVYEVKSR